MLGLAAVVTVPELTELIVITNGVRAGHAKTLTITPVERAASLPRTLAPAASS